MPETRFPLHDESLLPADVVGWVRSHFVAAEAAAALDMLAGALTHAGEFPEDRLLRSAAVASGGSLERLHYYVALLALDWRDVVVAGEYVPRDGELVRVRDLSQPIGADGRKP